MKIASNLAERDALKGIVAYIPSADGKWMCYESWDEVPEKYKPAAPTQEDMQAAVLSQYDAALMAHYDRVAGARNYDSYLSASLRAGYPGPFQAEGTAFAQWMDGCNVLGYQLIGDVKAGRKPLPTIDAFIAGLPPMVWP